MIILRWTNGSVRKVEQFGTVVLALYKGKVVYKWIYLTDFLDETILKRKAFLSEVSKAVEEEVIRASIALSEEED